MATPLYDIEQSYEVNENGPATSLPAVSEKVIGASPERLLLGFPVGYPIGVPASPLTANSSWIEVCGSQGFNVLTYKTVRNCEQPTPALPPPNWLFVDGYDSPISPGEPLPAVRVDRARTSVGDAVAYSMVNSCGIPSTGREESQEDIRRALTVLRPGQLLIVSVVGDYERLSGPDLVDDFVAAARLVEEAGARLIELNLSCPNSVNYEGNGLHPPICESPETAHAIVSAVRRALGPDTKLLAKLSYLSRERLEPVVEAMEALVDGISGINTLQVDIADDEDGPVFVGTLDDPAEPRRKAGLSGVAIRDCALDFVRSLALLRRKNQWEFDIVGMGGIMNAHDVRALMASGADAVQTATAASNNPDLPKQLCSDGHPVPSDEERLVALLEAALSDRRWRFRTVDGLAKDLKLTPERVLDLLAEHPGVARKSAMNDPKGRRLYAASRRRATLREKLEEYRWILAR